MKHTEIASELFSKRYYCSQAVLAAFAEELGMTKEQALRVGACFGGGMCKDGDYESQQRANSYAVRFLDKFAKQNGSYICRELLDCDISTDEGKAYARANGLYATECPKMIESAVLIAEKLINE